MNDNNVLLEVKNLRVSFALTEATVQAVDGVTFTIEAGKTLGIVGESGCGKSVTARAILGMVRPPGRITAGEILYHGKSGAPVDLAKLPPNSQEIRSVRWGDIAMIFQEPMTSLSPVHTIGNQMIEAIQLHKAVSKRDAEAISVDMMKRVGLPTPERLLSRYRHELSGGMRQRVMIAMALTCSPRLLIADEPTTALDVTTQAQILDLMRELQAEFQMAIMFITHNLGVIAEMADEVIVMYLGKEVEVADVDTIFHNASHPYTQALLRSIPRHDVVVEQLATIEGTVPDPTAIPSGCAFHPRCQHYQRGVCKVPSLIELSDNHYVRCARALDLKH
ncbi:MAG: ABC transporter ATP-binding protein [Anaerolineae bacterium]|nr:ABC transporter ATP-binding protein [Anaerolineae bacterium]NUQ04064.1 ABC transporter ATP-binding protein [Anaerolineae bacterium]